MFNFKQYAFILFLFAFSIPSSAQFFIEGGLGNANAEEDDIEGDDMYSRIAAGYQYSDALSFEGGYWDLGEPEDGPVIAAADGIYAAVKGTFDTGGSAGVFGRVGLYSWDSTICVRSVGCLDDSGSDIFFGGGVGFAAGPGTFNLELHLMSLEDVDVTTIGASYSYRFDAK